MLRAIGLDSMDSFISSTIPEAIRSGGEELNGVPQVGASEVEALAELKTMAELTMLARATLEWGRRN